MSGGGVDVTVDSSKLVKLAEAKVKCPVCGAEEFTLTDYLYDMPMVGKVIITSGRCSRCGYRYTDVRLAEPQPPRRIVMRVDSPEDVDALVVKAASATVKVPELGLEMTPGPASQGFITTIEGLIRRFIDALDMLCRWGEADEETCRRKRRELEEAAEGRRSYTVVIEDPEGVSTIVSPKARIEPLQQESRGAPSG